MRRLTRMMLARIAFRSFFLQSSWNYRGMMSMGFLYAISPALDQIHQSTHAREGAYLRHLEYFNTNPYFSSIVMGVTLALEERLSHGQIAEAIIPAREVMHRDRFRQKLPRKPFTTPKRG